MPESISPQPGKPFQRRLFAGDSIKTGAYQFVPLPFVDDWLTARQRKGMVRAVLDARGLSYDREVPRLLAGGSVSLTGQLASVAKGLVLKPVRKVFRSVFFWMTAHRAARAVVETYFLGRFLHHSALGSQNGGTHLTESDGRRLAAAFQDVSKNMDVKAASHVVGNLGKLIVSHWSRSKTPNPVDLRGAIEDEAPGFIDKFDRLIDQKLT